MKTGVLASLGSALRAPAGRRPFLNSRSSSLRSQRYDSRARPAFIRARDRPVGAVAHGRGRERIAHVHVIVENRRAAGECIPAAAGEQPAVG